MENDFDRKVLEFRGHELETNGLHTLQLNVGLRCNQLCTHCHVDAGPDRNEVMSWETMQAVIRVARILRPKLVDITGGAPELNVHLPSLITALRSDGHDVQVRTNLTVLLKPGMQVLIDRYYESGVKLVASLPCYLQPEVDHVRGERVFEKSIAALRLLNAAGFGTHPEHVLDLVYNPERDFLPPPQAKLANDYHEQLPGNYGIHFNSLLTITNMPVGRFLAWLRKQGRYERYRSLLRDCFNPATLDHLMCLSQIDVGWDGLVYDCDFNLAAGMPVELELLADGVQCARSRPCHIQEFDPVKHSRRRIRTGEHCFGCTAGCGSSCGGALQ
jgi:radical SAM/Cys-rich protein